MSFFKRRWDQFKCLHWWTKGLLVDVWYGKGYKYEYQCYYCGKMIHKWDFEAPISMAKSPYDDARDKFKEDPVSNMSPPLIRVD